MHTLRTVAELRRHLAGARAIGRRIGLVPTMGALHEGHLALIRRSAATTDVTVVSIFVNPTQFAPGEDFAAYPRDLARDSGLAEAAGARVLLVPEAEEVYPDGFQTSVEPGPLAAGLCGPFRPGHFRGVATVVAKLFNMAAPDTAFFGQKDYQQSVIIRRMARDLDMPVAVETVPTVREADGLALSSRNAYLDADERRRAACLSRGLFAGKATFDKGERQAAEVIANARAAMTEVDNLQYLELVDAETLAAVTGAVDRPAVLAVAAYIGKTRLIDNVLLTPDET